MLSSPTSQIVLEKHEDSLGVDIRESETDLVASQRAWLNNEELIFFSSFFQPWFKPINSLAATRRTVVLKTDAPISNGHVPLAAGWPRDLPLSSVPRPGMLYIVSSENLSPLGLW